MIAFQSRRRHPDSGLARRPNGRISEYGRRAYTRASEGARQAAPAIRTAAEWAAPRLRKGAKFTARVAGDTLQLAGAAVGGIGAYTSRGAKWVGEKMEKWGHKSNPRGAADESLASEITLFTYNDDQLKPRWRAVVAILKQKVKSGTYRHGDAIKLFAPVANAGARKAASGGWLDSAGAATKAAAAEMMAAEFELGDPVGRKVKKNPPRKTARRAATRKAHKNPRRAGAKRRITIQTKNGPVSFTSR